MFTHSTLSTSSTFFAFRVGLLLAGLGLRMALAPAQVQAQTVPSDPAVTVSKATEFTQGLMKVVKDLNAKREEMHVPGAALVIVKDDKIVVIQGMGLRDVAQNRPVTPKTMFAIGSSTKAFTAMTVMMSVEDKKLALADSPHKYLPYFKLRDPEADAKITISDLLCHRSGLERTDLAWYTGKLNSREIIRVAGEAKPSAKFGEKFQYQNIMFLTAGEVVAAAQKRPWGDVLRQRIFRPLGMKDTTLSVDAMQQRDDFSLGYGYNPGTKETRVLPIRDLRMIAPAGAINSNVQDMAQWLRLMLGGGTFQGKQMLSQENFNQLITKHMDVAGSMSYGYGWFLRDWHGHKVVEHGGNIDGFSAEVALMPDQNLGFVLLTNLNTTPLQSLSLDIVWNDLVALPPAAASSESTATAAPSAPAGDPGREVGVYPITKGLDLAVVLKNSGLVVQPTGQPEFPLKNIGGRKYTLGPPAPPGIFLTFRPDKDDPTKTELFFEQNGFTTTVKPKAAAPAFVSPITVEDLIAKTILAAGGEANLRKHKSLQVRFAMEMPSQGITGEGVTYARAPYANAQAVALRAAGRKIATTRSYFNGKKGGSENSFASSAPTPESKIAEARLSADFYRELNWKTDFKTITIKGIEKLGDEEVYVVEKTPEKGEPIVERYATKTFLLLQREAQMFDSESGMRIITIETFSDYRPVGGIMVPYKTVQTQMGQNETIIQVKEVRFDTRIPDVVFQPSHKS